MKRRIFVKVLIVFILLISITNVTVMANSYTSPTQFDSYHSSGNTAVDKVMDNSLSLALSLIRSVAIGWAIIMLLTIAIKYMVATPDVKGQLKKDTPTYVIASILLFGAGGLMQLITYFVSDTVGL